MGQAKNEWIETQERGWSAPETCVCPDCIEEEFLREVVKKRAVEPECSYCGRKEDAPTIAAPLEEVLPYIANAFFRHYQEPGAAGLPRDSGEWVGEELFTDTADALVSVGLSVEGQLFEDICASFLGDTWVPAPDGWWLGEHEHDRLRHAWEGFVHKTKYASRYFFLNTDNGDDDLGPGYAPERILEIIGAHIQELCLWEELPAGLTLYRARRASCGEKKLRDFHELCPPPPTRAAAGRMNPPGISYGYCARDASTALLEVADGPPATFALAEFRLKKPMLAVDLTDLPPIPSIFDTERYRERDSLIFLHSFVRAISIPVLKDGREHVEYVPSQIASEYLAQVLHLRDGERADALLYPSAVDPGATNVVLFPPREYGTEWEELLELAGATDVNLLDWKDYGALADRSFVLPYIAPAGSPRAEKARDRQ